MKTSVVGLGAIVVDQQMMLDRFPAENEKERAASFRQQVGGPVPTALVFLKRLGLDCHLISPWGVDANGLTVEADLNREGVSWSETCRSPERTTGTAHVWTSVKNGSRTIVASQCSWDGFHLSAEDISTLQNCRLLHLDGTGGTVALQAAELVKSAGGTVTIDAGAPKAATSDLISLADVFSFPERFAQQLFGSADIEAAGKEILERGAKAAVCTQGENGAIVFEGDRRTTIPAFSVTTVDSTGAGDVFCGGMISRLIQDDSLVNAVRTGAAAAALKCQHIGNRSALPQLAEIEKLLHSM